MERPGAQRKAAASIAGLGIAGVVDALRETTQSLAIEAVQSAIADAGLSVGDMDGFILCRSGGATDDDIGLDIFGTLGCGDLNFLKLVLMEGASSVSAIQVAALAVESGMADVVGVVFSDAPLRKGRQIRSSFGRTKTGRGLEGLRYTAGLYGGASVYALRASRYLHTFGLTGEALGHVAITARRWAAQSPLARFQAPLTMDDYLASRPVAEPFRLFDCAIPVNGAVCVIVTTPERARDCAKPAVDIIGMGQGHGGPSFPDDPAFSVSGASARAGAKAFSMARVSMADLGSCQLYDPFTIVTLASLEAYGVCRRGEAASYVSDGNCAPGGPMPTNTSGGHLSGFYLQGMTPVAEAISQARGEAGNRQCSIDKPILVSNDGGCFSHSAALIVQNGRWSQ